MIRTQQKQNQQTPKKPSSQKEVVEQTFLEHIYELRSRIFWVVLTIVLASAAGFQFKDELIAVIMAPLNGQKLVYLTPGGGFGFIFTLAIYFGVLVAIPAIVFHVYRFLQPLLQRTSRVLVAVFMLLSCLLAAGGAAFGYFVTIPAALNFLATFAGDAVTPNLTADSYLNFVVSYVLGLAALFQLPLLLFLFDHVRPFPPGSLLSTQRFIIIGATIVAAIITPTPDAFNMAIVAVPIVTIYQFGVVAIFIRHRLIARATRRRDARQKRSTAVQEDREPLTQIFRGIDGHRSPSVAPNRSITRRGYSTEPIKRARLSVASNSVSSVTMRPPRKAVDGFVRTKQPQPPVMSRSALAAERFAASRNNTPAQPTRSLDGLSVLGYTPHS